jgi:hypothetical protein
MKKLHYLLYALTFVLHSRSTSSVPATPFTFKQKQQDGEYKIDLQMHGDEFFHLISDSLGYIVLKDERNRSVYGIVEDETGEIIKTENVVGEMDPRNVLELQNGLLKNRWSLLKATQIHARRSRSTTMEENYPMSEMTPANKESSHRHLRFRRDEHNRTLPNLVVLIKFRRLVHFPSFSSLILSCIR